MAIKLASLLYLSAPGHPKLGGCATACWENLRTNPPKHDLKVYSEFDWGDGCIKLKGNPEALIAGGAPQGIDPRVWLPHAIFLAGMRIAREDGYTHVLFLESDCRVGCRHFDEAVFEEFFTLGRPCIAGGTLVTYNPCNFNHLAHQRWAKLIGRNPRKNFPSATYEPPRTYGWKGSADRFPSCVYPNGAPAVYSMNWIGRFFDLNDGYASRCAANGAFDVEFGRQTWKQFAEDSYEVLGFLDSVYGGYGDVLTTEADRQRMLTSGEVAIVHQIKSAWQP